jgi:alpha-glucuronidase
MSQLIDSGYAAWLGYRKIDDELRRTEYQSWGANIVITQNTPLRRALAAELFQGLSIMLGITPDIYAEPKSASFIIIDTFNQSSLIREHVQAEEIAELGEEGFLLKAVTVSQGNYIVLTGKGERGLLYGAYALLRLLRTETDLTSLYRLENPRNPLRLVNQWDNPDGSIERGYAGRSIFYEKNSISPNFKRIGDYARLLASIGINGIVLNNVNVRDAAIRFITPEYLTGISELADLFGAYGIKVYLSINYAAPIVVGSLASADPLDPQVRIWWQQKAKEIYRYMPDFGGFLVKADSEFTPGPYTYNRTHAEGANMLAEALQPFGGLVIWRCFVYNCTQDWRDRTIDRAKAAYHNFKPLDGQFLDNVILQVKNGPMDFQVREPVSPLLGGLSQTNQLIELQITQEYTGQQRHLCYLVPLWKETLDFETYAQGPESTVKRIVDGSLFKRKYGGFAGVANIGNDQNWTGHDLAQANLYGFGRLAWDPDLTAAAITNEWIRLTFPHQPAVIEGITNMLLASWKTYEKYNAPLGIGWMVNPNHHYGPNVDGYEYSRWGTYHRADLTGIGVDRTRQSGTGFTGQYYPVNAERYESLATCPDELLLFFHHVAYTHRLHSGETVIQHIYNSHFAGVEQVAAFIERWLQLQPFMHEGCFARVLKRLNEQLEHAREWRDVINTYFYRKTGIKDEQNRQIFP